MHMTDADDASCVVPAPHAAAVDIAKEKIAALQPLEHLLDRRLCRALEPTPREARFGPGVASAYPLRAHGPALHFSAGSARSNKLKRRRIALPR